MVNSFDSLYESRLLRREAGEGWHPNGPNQKLLGAIVVREQQVDDLVSYHWDNGYDENETKELLDVYREQSQTVQQLKNDLEISDPPPFH